MERLVKEGRWDELRQNHADRTLQNPPTAISKTLEKSLNNQLKIQDFKNVQIEERLAYLTSHYLEYRHLNKVNTKGKVLLDTFGCPIPLSIPDGSKASLELLMKLHSKSVEVQAEIDNKKEQGKFDSSRPIDLASLQYLLEPKKKNI